MYTNTDFVAIKQYNGNSIKISSGKIGFFDYSNIITHFDKTPSTLIYKNCSKVLCFSTKTQNQSESVDIAKLYSAQNEKSSYRKSYIAWDDIKRANKPKSYTDKTKHLGKNSQALLSVIIQKLRKKDKVFLNHKYISTITRCERRQNQNIIKELSFVLDINYRNSVFDNDKKYRYCYEFSLKKLNHFNLSNSADLANSVGQKFSRYSIYKENKINNNRSIKSNFFEKDFSRSDTQNTNSFLKNKNITAEISNKQTSSSMKLAANHSISQNNIIKKNTDISKGLESEQVDPRKQQQTEFGKAKRLEEFYPLLEEDVCLLQKESGRKFDTRAMNEILKNMAKKLTKPKFFSKKGFIAYMSKAFRYEMRDAVKINNNTFQIKANLSNDEKLVKEQEAFLCKVEYSLEVNPEWHLRKKLAAVLERDRAYNILTSWRSCKRVGDSFRIYLTKPVELSAGDRKIIHQAVLATQVKNDDEILLCIEQTEIITIKEEVVKDMSVLSSQSNKQDLKRIFPDNAWGRLRESMMVLTGMVTGDAIALDKSWFSILEANIDDQRKQIKLQAPTKFINDWIESNYLQLIEKAAKNIGYSFAGVEFSGN